jgi:hypothetical protein
MWMSSFLSTTHWKYCLFPHGNGTSCTLWWKITWWHTQGAIF